MIPVVISASAFEKNECACLWRIREISQTQLRFTVGLLLDQQFLDNYDNVAEIFPANGFKMSEWVDSTQQPLKVEMRTQAEKLIKDQIVVLDARYYDPHVITMLLREISEIWFQMTTWPPAFALVMDDYHAPSFVRELSATFYIQPLPASKFAIQTEVRHLRKQIMCFRWLGFSRLSRCARFVNAFLQKLKKYVNKKFF
jgi:hypothetical protein